LPRHVDRHAEEVAGVLTGVEDRLGGRRAEPEARADVRAIRLDHPLLPLPVEERPASVVLVLDVEDRHVCPIQEPFAPVVEEAQLHPGAVRPGGSCRPHGQKPPEHRSPLTHRDPDLAGGALGRGGLSSVGLAADRVVGLRRHRSPAFEAQHRSPGHVHAHDLVPARSLGGQEPNREHSLQATTCLVVDDQWRHRLVGLEPPLSQRRAEFPMPLQHCDRAGEFFGGGDRLDT
jgi:hypothetical protein